MKTTADTPIILKSEEIGNGRVRYCLIETFKDSEDGKKVPVYGVRVCSTLFGCEDISEVEDLTCCKENAEEFFEMCVSNMVLPCTLCDIAADYIS